MVLLCISSIHVAFAARMLEEDELIFVMFYAPWCAASRRLTVEFEKAAIYMKNEVSLPLNSVYFFTSM